MDDIASIAAKIRALLEKTVDNGCTEAEAVAAAALVAKLLAKYNLTLDEVRMRASPFSRRQETHDGNVGERLWKVAAAISKLTGARYWRSRPGVYPVEINFFGFDHEVAVAKYLLEICARAMRTEEMRIVNERWPRVIRRSQVLPFLDGMADRLAQRILELVPPAPTGKGLVVLRQSLIDAAMADAGIHTGTRKARASRDLDVSYADGRRAAEGVALNQGIRGADGPARMLL